MLHVHTNLCFTTRTWKGFEIIEQTYESFDKVYFMILNVKPLSNTVESLCNLNSYAFWQSRSFGITFDVTMSSKNHKHVL